MEESGSTNSQAVGGEKEVEVQIESSNATKNKNDDEKVAGETVAVGGGSVKVDSTTVSPEDFSVTGPVSTDAVTTAIETSEVDILPSNKGQRNVTFYKGYKYTLHSVHNGIEYNRCAE